MTETRAEKAQRLVDGVTAIVRTDSSTYAIVREGNKHYVAKIYVGGHFHCTCKWGVTHSHTDDFCAHALAVRLVVEKEE